MSLLRKWWRRYGINPLDRKLKQAHKQGHYRFLLCWNRGLGDIPLGLYALVYRIRQMIPRAEVTFLTRSDLAPGFRLLEGVECLVDPAWRRGVAHQINPAVCNLAHFDVVIQDPDPTAWLMWQRGKLVPRLSWQSCWDAYADRLPHELYVGVHVDSQTMYGYNKNWPVSHWESLFEALPQEYGILLFGFADTRHVYQSNRVIDLRGKTELIELLSIIKNRCRYLICPDSGVLSMTYYLDAAFSLDVISLWADPHQGVLKQGVPSPNPYLVHHPLIAPHKDVSQITVSQVLGCLQGQRCL